MKHARLKGMAEGPLKQLTQALEKAKAKICARVENPFHVVKNLFKHKKARCNVWHKTVYYAKRCYRRHGRFHCQAQRDRRS
jgi:hypothetical protein